MEFDISCDTFLRLANLPMNFKETEATPETQTIRIEFNGAHILAISTNRKFAAIERIGDNAKGFKGAMHLNLDASLIAQCQVEKAFGGRIFVVYNEMLKFASCKTTMGFSVPHSIAFTDATPLMDKWRTWFSTAEITKSKGAMFIDAERMNILLASAPSGKVRFPTFIDDQQPVLVRDYIDQNWLGLFMTNVKKDDGSVIRVEPATKPDWI